MRPNEYTNVHEKYTIAGCFCSRERPGCQKPASVTESILWGVLRKPCAWYAGTVIHSGGSEAGCPAAGKSECPELFCVLPLAPLASPNTPSYSLPPLLPGLVQAPAPFPAPLDRAASPVDIDRTIFFLQWGKKLFFISSSCSLLQLLVDSLLHSKAPFQSTPKSRECLLWYNCGYICNIIHHVFIICYFRRQSMETEEVLDKLWKIHLFSELAKLCGDRHTVLKQDVIERAGTESFQVHLLLIVPEFICCYSHSYEQYENTE